MMLIRKAGERDWQVPSTNAYSNEDALQALVADAPHLLPGATDARLVVVREMPIAEGRADVVGVDPTGAITVVECKLNVNPDIKRTIIGQIFAYASGLWEMTYEEFNQAFVLQGGTSLTAQVAALTGESFDQEAFRTTVTANLREGRFRLVIVVDKITDELKRIVRYLNTHTNSTVQVLALELGYTAHDGVEILLPMSYGEESVETKAAPKRKWDVESVFAQLNTLISTSAIAQVRRLVDLLRASGYDVSTGIGLFATLNAQRSVGTRVATPLSIYEWSSGIVRCAINFEWLIPFHTPDQLARLADQLRSIEGTAKDLAPLEAARYKKRPAWQIEKLFAQPNAVAIIAEALAELVQQPPEPALSPSTDAALIEPGA